MSNGSIIVCNKDVGNFRHLKHRPFIYKFIPMSHSCFLLKLYQIMPLPIYMKKG